MSIDVNEQFTAERQSQIATAIDAEARRVEAAAERAADFDQRVQDGKLRDIGGGQFRVTDPGSRDDGEVLRLQRETSGRMLLLPQHGLDESTGKVALYTRVPAWHALGTVIPEGLASVDEVLAAAGLNYTVIPRAILYRDGEGELREHEHEVLNVRDDTYASFKAVSPFYRRFQNDVAFSFLQSLVEEYGVVWESAGALRSGARTFVSMRLPKSVIIDVDGINDEIVLFLVAINSFDGSSRFKVVVTPWRPVCGNTERLSIRDAVTSWGMSHSGNPAKKIEEAGRSLRLALTYTERFAEDENALAQTAITNAQFWAIVSDLIPLPAEEPTDRQRKYVGEQRDAMASVFATNVEALGRTAYAAERAVTEWADWKTAIRGEGLRGPNLAVRATRMLEGQYDELKSQAHRQLLTLVRR